MFGSSAGFAARLDLADLDGANGFRVDGAKYDSSGWSVAGAGDVNGDGIDDVIIGAPGSRYSYDSRSYVVFGSSASFTASLDLSSLDGANGFRLDGISPVDRSGWSVAGAGDVNADGVEDLIIGAWGAGREGQEYAGESYVVFGSTAGFAANFNLAALDGGDGFRIVGIDEFDFSGSSVAGAGDVNGDGIDDLIIGAPGLNGEAGESYVVFGSAAGFDASLDLSSLGGATGFRIDGIEGSDHSGTSVAGAGDVNGDGLDDLIIGAPDGYPFDDAGESYVVFGFRPPIRGGPGPDELAGTEFNDRMFGRAGDDVLDGGAGRDRLKGGWGDDRIVGGAGRDRIVGGLGDDVLSGGGGSDVFVFGSGFGSDRVRDFDAEPAGGQDKIDLRRLEVTEASFRDDVTIADRGEDTRVSVEGQGTVLCYNVSGVGDNSIDVSDFLLLA